MMNTELTATLEQVQIYAQQNQQEYLTVELFLLQLLENKSAKSLLQACGCNFTTLKEGLLKDLEENKEFMAEPRPLRPSRGFELVMQRAVQQVQQSGRKELSGAHVIISILSETESTSAYLLDSQGITRAAAIRAFSHGGSREEVDSGQFADDDAGDPNQRPLDRFSVNLNEEAKAGKIDPMIGRDKELERVLQVLGRRRKNNPLLVGEAGVGKTAIAEGLALKIVNGNVPPFLKDAIVYSLDLGAIVAGTKYRGDFEKRFKGILKDIEEEENAVLFIDEIHTIIGAGAANGGAMDVGNLLKPLLSAGKLRCIGATTYQEHKTIFEKEKALSRRFQKIDVVEPTVEESVQILMGLKSKYEEHHGVSYSEDAITAAVKLSAKYMNDRFLPDKAIDIMDEAGSRQKVLPENERINNIDVSVIEKVIASIARIPEKSVESSEVNALKTIDYDLRLSVFGQDHAIDSVSAAIRMGRSGLGDENKPVGSFLFAGPTGVGKTELSQQLAKTLGVELLRFDMSEYSEKHSVSRLIGAPAGYVGYEEGGLLTDAVIKNPHSVVLLDEIEKADPSIYNILLQVMDNGTLTDNTGRVADFRNITFIMTTNAGIQTIEKRSIGFKSDETNHDGMAELAKVFPPEFRNRLDEVIWFNHLGKDVISSVVNKFINELQMKLDEKEVNLTVSSAAKDWFAEKGYDRAMGARPMSRVFQVHLKKQLANELLFGELEKGGSVKVGVAKGELTIKCIAAKVAVS